jgi:hypothetical protein
MIDRWSLPHYSARLFHKGQSLRIKWIVLHGGVVSRRDEISDLERRATVPRKPSWEGGREAGEESDVSCLSHWPEGVSFQSYSDRAAHWYVFASTGLIGRFFGNIPQGQEGGMGQQCLVTVYETLDVCRFSHLQTILQTKWSTETSGDRLVTDMKFEASDEKGFWRLVQKDPQASEILQEDPSAADKDQSRERWDGAKTHWL